MKRMLPGLLAVFVLALTCGLPPAASRSSAAQRRRPLSDSDDPPPVRGMPRRQEEEPAYTPARPKPGDMDADGIADADERRLLDKFAPVFRHDTTESHHPIKVATYLGLVSLYFNHKDILHFPCRDHVVLEQGRVDLRSLLRQVHPTGCDHRGQTLPSNGPVRGNEFYYLHLNNYVSCLRVSTECTRSANEQCQGSSDPNCYRQALSDCQREFMRAQREALRRGETIDSGAVCEEPGPAFGARNDNQLEVYAAVRPSSEVYRGYNIFLKALYAENTLIGAGGFGYHAADWEGVSIHITRDERIAHITFYQHEGSQKVGPPGAGGARPWDVPGFELEGGTHPVVYVAALSHAMYPHAGTNTRGVLLPSDRHQGNGLVFHTQGHIINVGRTEFPMPGGEWIEYRGYWGQDWNPADIFGINLEGASPPTPRF